MWEKPSVDCSRCIPRAACMSVHLCMPLEQYHYHFLHLQPEALLYAFVFPLLSLQEPPVTKLSHPNLEWTSKINNFKVFGPITIK